MQARNPSCLWNTGQTSPEVQKRSIKRSTIALTSYCKVPRKPVNASFNHTDYICNILLVNNDVLSDRSVSENNQSALSWSQKDNGLSRIGEMSDDVLTNAIVYRIKHW